MKLPQHLAWINKIFYILKPVNWLIFPIIIYRRLISPWLPNVCRFSPTCSEYAIQALKTHGCFKGVVLASWRILRCNPFGGSGYDPVPPKKSNTKNKYER